MKALCVQQPWASLIARGHKLIETRTWATGYRGPLLIVASKRVDNQAARQLAGTIAGLGMMDDSFLTGVALCTVRLVDCRPMVFADEPWAYCPVYEQAWAWVLDQVQPVAPFPVRGRLGLFEIACHCNYI